MSLSMHASLFRINRVAQHTRVSRWPMHYDMYISSSSSSKCHLQTSSTTDVYTTANFWSKPNDRLLFDDDDYESIDASELTEKQKLASPVRVFVCISPTRDSFRSNAMLSGLCNSMRMGYRWRELKDWELSFSSSIRSKTSKLQLKWSLFTETKIIINHTIGNSTTVCSFILPISRHRTHKSNHGVFTGTKSAAMYRFRELYNRATGTYGHRLCRAVTDQTRQHLIATQTNVECSLTACPVSLTTWRKSVVLAPEGPIVVRWNW
jgi:hypothetical protein